MEFPSRGPSSSGHGAVEVPSTSSKRRQSCEEIYLAQCSGHDARDTQDADTQQREFIADSQNMPGKADVTVYDSSQPSPNMQLSAGCDPEDLAPAPLTPTISGHAQDQVLRDAPEGAEDTNRSSDSQEVVPHGHPSPPNYQSQPLPELPLQEVSSNRNITVTPAGKRTQDIADSSTVPETSPATQNVLRPMGDISFSMGLNGDEGDVDLINVPGFTQDTGFEEALNQRASPEPTWMQNSRKERAGPVTNLAGKVPFTTPASSEGERFSTAPEVGVKKDCIQGGIV